MPRPLINSFNAGEMSFATDARVDIDKYRNGCRILENAIPKIQGGVYSRAGMEYMGAARYTNKDCRLIPFTFDVATSFVLEFGDLYIRFWSNGTQVLSGGLPYTIVSPYAEADLFNLQFTQVNDVVYIVDGDHHPQKLTRLADDSWTIEDVPWKWPAMQDENALVAGLGTPVVDRIIEVNTCEWPEYSWALTDGVLSGLAGTLSAVSKTVVIQEWNGAAWVTDATTGAFTTSIPADIASTGLVNQPKRMIYTYASGQGIEAGLSASVVSWKVGAVTLSTIDLNPTGSDASRTYLPQRSISEALVVGGRTYRARVVCLSTIPVGASCKLQSWNGATWVDVHTMTLASDLEDFYEWTEAGSSTTRHRMLWTGRSMQSDFTAAATFGKMSIELLTLSTETETTVRVHSTSGENVKMSSNLNLFVSGHVGSYWQIAHRRDAAYVSLTLGAADANSAELRVLGGYNLYTYGTWTGDVLLQRKRADGEWETIRTWTGKADRNVIATGTQDEEAVLRISWDYTSVSGTPRVVLEPNDSRVYGLVKVVTYVSATEVKVNILKDVWSTDATTAWSEGSWSTYRGFPRSITMDNQRIVYGGTANEPLTIWGSVIGDFENFQRSTLYDASYAFRIASAKGNGIVWMSNQARFIVGTQGDEWLVEPGSNADSGGVITATNVKITMQSSFGSAGVQPAAANDTIMFVERGRKRIREFVFQFDKQTFGAPDLCLLATHIFANTGVKQLAFASVPDPILWVVTEDDRLMAMTFERDQSVVGWSRHITDGTVESVCVIYGDEADEVWLLTKRSINGSDVKLLERLDPEKWSKLDEDNVEEMIYLDCAKLVTQASSTTVSGLSHLNGETVSVLADGIPVSDKVVSAGAITLDTAATKIVVGLPYTVKIQPNKLELGMQDGTSQGRRFHAVQAMLRFSMTGAAQYADSASGTFYDVLFRDPSRDATEFEPSYTGDKRIYLASRHRDSLDLTIRNTKPLPFGLLAIAPIVEASGQ